MTPDPAGIADVAIVGGGPAGLACAIAAAQQGLRAMVIDGMLPPIDKACGEGLMPDALAALSALGIDLTQPHQGWPMRGIRFTEAARRGPDLNVQAQLSRASGRGMRRLALHQCMLERATALGVRCSWQTVVQGIDAAAGIVFTNRGDLHARFIIGADGHQSRVRTAAGLDHASNSTPRIGLRQHFTIPPWTDFVEVHWSDHGQAYVTPVAEDEVCVAFVARQKFHGVSAALAYFPQLQQRLAHAAPGGPPRGSVTLSRSFKRVTRGRVALVGDASGSVDAVTGEGLALCFRQALTLGEALARNDLERYQRAHQALSRLPRLMATAMLLLDRSPRLRACVLGLLTRRPGLFARMLELHIGHAPLRLFGANGLLVTGIALGRELIDA